MSKNNAQNLPKTPGSRDEHDALGGIRLHADTLWGVHTERALCNFTISDRRVPFALIAALATVKRAAAEANAELGFLPREKADAICRACEILASDEERALALVPVDALQGGAGTSTNMNVNEVVANLALQSLGKKPGDYDVINPIDHVNLHQSTNDVYPTALKIAAIAGVRSLNEALSKLQGVFQLKEKEFQAIMKMGRTEMQPAVPMTLGQEFSAFAEAVSRDRWRTFKCEERLRLVNIGGTAIGTGLTAPRDYIFRVIEILRTHSGMGLARSENVVDGTANADVFVEVSGILKAAAVTMAKCAGDLRLLHFLGEIALPPLQAGSSIMPGKINPVMTECVMQASLVVRANDFIVSECAAHGTLQINEFMPLIASALLESIQILKNTALAFADHVNGITADAERCRSFLDNNVMLITALVPYVGYDKASALMKEFAAEKEKTLADFLAASVGAEIAGRVLTEANLVGLGADQGRKNG